MPENIVLRITMQPLGLMIEASVRGHTMSVNDAIIANAIEGLKKKPVLAVHLLVAVALASLILWCGKLFLNYVLRCSLCAPNFNILIIFTLIITSLSLGFYVNFWHNLREAIRSSVPTMFDEALADYTKFIQSIMDKTVYHFIREHTKDIPIRGIAVVISSYYLTWVTGLYSIDLMLYIVSNHRYSMFGYMLENAHLIPVTFLAGFTLAQSIRPWQESKEERGSAPTSNTIIINMQYLQSFLERFTSFEGLGKVWRYSKTAWGRVFVNFVENLLALPPLMNFGRPFVLDVFQTPYLKSTGPQNKPKDMPADVIERMIRKDAIEDYWLEPFKRECEELPRTEVPLLRKACWYKVYRRKGSNWVRIGYAMLLVITKQGEEKKFVKEHFDECMGILRTRLRGDKQYCYDVVKELWKMYLQEKGVIIVLLLGNEELLGLKLLLT